MLNGYLIPLQVLLVLFDMTTFTLQWQRRQAQYFTKDLASGIGLDMILVPGGSFLMGSPDTEPERQDRESPQHTVTVPPFFMGRYSVTQAQWKVIARLLQVKRKLKLDPSHFKGNHRPVECVEWFDAVEFCDRISHKTGRTYRLPSEAEWEYACRAGTATPFHVGETITTDLANYNGNHTYRQGAEGVYREETTDVGSFPPNAYGLCDMHGNVDEWCQDHWHNNYEGAPLDSSAWLTENEQARVRRGGSWYNNPQVCRSAYRDRDFPDLPDSSLGFRVVCVMP